MSNIPVAKRIIRFPFLVIFYMVKILFTVDFALSIAVFSAFFRWAVVDKATFKEACIYWWHSIWFLWYPLFSDECDASWYVIRNLDRKWGTD